MNDRQLDQSLRAAFPAPAETACLDAKIDRALSERPASRAPRRIALGFALTAALAVGLVALPAAPAQAGISFGAILGALESSPSVRIRQYAVDAKGERFLAETVDVAGDARHAFGRHGTLDRYEVGPKTLTFDPLLRAFVVRPRDRGHVSLKLPLVPGKGAYGGLDTEVVRAKQGDRDVLRATATGRGFRFVFDASPTSRLPLAARREVREGDGWRTVEASEFDYATPVRVAPPANVARLTPTQAGAVYRRDLSDRVLAEMPLEKGRIVVRRLDVAQDGSVFVAFQRGVPRSPDFNGYTFRLTDDLGTEYVRVGETYTQGFEGAPGPDGPFAMEVFVPLKPATPWRPRTLTLQAHRYASLAWAGTVERVHPGPDGRPEPWPGILIQREEDRDPAPADLPVQAFAEPTCGAAPAWAAAFSEEAFGDAFLASVAKTDARARRALAEERAEDAERLLGEELYLKRERARRGYGAAPQDDTLTKLAQARAMGGNPRP